MESYKNSNEELVLQNRELKAINTELEKTNESVYRQLMDVKEENIKMEECIKNLIGYNLEFLKEVSTVPDSSFNDLVNSFLLSEASEITVDPNETYKKGNSCQQGSIRGSVELGQYALRNITNNSGNNMRNSNNYILAASEPNNQQLTQHQLESLKSRVNKTLTNNKEDKRNEIRKTEKISVKTLNRKTKWIYDNNYLCSDTSFIEEESNIFFNQSSICQISSIVQKPIRNKNIIKISNAPSSTPFKKSDKHYKAIISNKFPLVKVHKMNIKDIKRLTSKSTLAESKKTNLTNRINLNKKTEDKTLTKNSAKLTQCISSRPKRKIENRIYKETPINIKLRYDPKNKTTTRKMSSES